MSTVTVYPLSTSPITITYALVPLAGALIVGVETPSPRWEVLPRGSAGQVLVSTATGIQWQNPSTAPHKNTHVSGGTDQFTSSDLLEAVVKRVQESGGPTTLTLGSISDALFLKRSGTSIVGSAIAISDVTNLQSALDGKASTSHKSTHVSGGSDAFASTDILEAVVKRLQESGGPTNLTIGAISDGQYLRRSGTNIVGAAAGGSSEVSIIDFGADPSGTNSSSTAISDAIASLPSTGGIVKFPKGSYRITGSITINKNGVQLVGEGGNGTTSGTSATRVFWDGSSGGTMLVTSGNLIGIGIRGIMFDGNTSAATALQLENIARSWFEDILVTRWTGPAIVLRGTSGGASTEQNVFILVNALGPSGSSADGLVLGASDSSHAGASQNTFIRCMFHRSDATGRGSIIFRYADNNEFYAIRLRAPAPNPDTGDAIRFEVPSGTQLFPHSNHFYRLVARGGYTVSGTWTPSFWSLWTAWTSDGNSSPPTLSKVAIFSADHGVFSGEIVGIPYTWAMRTGTLATTGTEFFSPSGTHLLSATESAVQVVIPVSMRVFHWRVSLSSAPGAGTSRTFTIRVNGSNTSATITISDTNTTGTWTGTLDLSAGDLVAVSSTVTNVPTGANARSSMRVRETAV